MRTLTVSLAACLVLWVNVSKAQIVGGRQIVSADLIAARVGPDGSLAVGVRFRIEAGWYMYWKNPGDAGLPISVEWVLPEGWKAETLRFPVPSKFVHGDIVAYGYENEVVLTSTIIPSGNESGIIRANLDWLVCKESCVRGKTGVALETSRLDPENSSLISAALSRMPASQHALKVSLSAATVRQVDDQWVFEAALEGDEAAGVSDFYPETNDDVVIDYSSVRVEGNRLSFTLSKENTGAESVVVKGLLLAKGRGYEYSVPITFSSF